eukprot:362927-Prymnesium_polylepis.1
MHHHQRQQCGFAHALRHAFGNSTHQGTRGEAGRCPRVAHLRVGSTRTRQTTSRAAPRQRQAQCSPAQRSQCTERSARPRTVSTEQSWPRAMLQSRVEGRQCREGHTSAWHSAPGVRTGKCREEQWWTAEIDQNHAPTQAAATVSASLHM